MSSISTSTKRLWVLAEPDALLLPSLIARLASGSRIEGIIEIHFSVPWKNRARNLKKLHGMFGTRALAAVAASMVAARVLDRILPGRYFSLRKVAKRFRVPFYRCEGFDDPKLAELLSSQVRGGPVFTQVGRLVPASLVKNHVLINKHCSLLPADAGVYPVFWGMLRGDPQHGVSIHRMNETFDQGAILAQGTVPARGTLFERYHRLYDLAGELLRKLLEGGCDWNTPGVIAGGSQAASYHSYATRKERKDFLHKGLRFGSPLRFK